MRAVSTGAVITPSGFSNHYQWGRLKADPADWMRRYFDAIVYPADWCHRRLAWRVPLMTFRKAELQPFASTHALMIDSCDEHRIFDLALNESEDYDRFGEDDCGNSMRRPAAQLDRSRAVVGMAADKGDELARLRAENARLAGFIDANGIEWRLHDPALMPVNDLAG